MTTPRIAVVAHLFPATSETFVVDHVLGLVRHGFQVHVLADRLGSALADVLAAGNGSLSAEALAPRRPGVASAVQALAAASRAVLQAPLLVRTALGRSLSLRAPALARGLRGFAPDLVHAHFASNGLTAALATPAPVPLVVELHGWDFTVLPRQLGWPVLRRQLRRAVLVAHSAYAEREIAAGLGRRPARVQLGVDLERFVGSERGDRWSSPLRLLTVGRLVQQKGHGVAIRALQLLREGPPAADARLRIVGEGPELAALKGLVRDLRLPEGAVELVGPLPPSGIQREMAAAHVLLVPSVVGADGAVEAFGRVALEGLASGLPVIASRTGGLPEAIGAAGLTVAPGDPTALAAAVRAVLEEAPATWAGRARAHAAHASLEQMWDEYARVSLEALGRHPVSGTAR